MIQLRARLAAVLASAATLALVWAGGAVAAPSDVDPAFGGGSGFVVTPVSGGQDVGNFVLPRADGRIVVVAHSRPNGAVARPLVLRYLSSGQLDPGFGAGGIAQFVLGAVDYIPVAAALDALGRVYVLAQGPTVVDASSTGGPTDYRLLRVTEGGTLDATFGTGGVVQLRASDFSTSSPPYHPPVLLLQALTATSDGGVALAGSYDYQQFTNCCYLARGLVVRLNVDGTYNANFGTGGVLRFSAGNSSNVVLRAILPAPAGKLVLAGYRQAINGGPSLPLLARIDASGSSDASFGSGGMTDVPGLTSTTLTQVAAWPDGRLVAAAGSDGTAIEIVGFSADGALDPAFGIGGVARVTAGTPTVNGLAAQANGKVLALVHLPADVDPGDYLFRFTDTGALDAAFGASGKLRTNRMLGIALQSDGRILGTGGTSAFTASPGSVFVARYLGDPGEVAPQVAYHYTGAPFNTIQNFQPPCAHAPCVAYTTDMRVTGRFTVATALAANLTNQDIAAAITSFSFTDGVQTLTLAAAFSSASVSTDDQGNITSASLSLTRFTSGAPFAPGAWYNRIRIGAPAVGGGSLGLVNAQCAGASCLDLVTNLNAYSIGASSVPGTWTRRNTGGGTVNLNQHGVSGSWFQPATSGQGVELDVFPDLIAPTIGYVFGSWFTFDHASAGGAERQRWYTFDGPVFGGTSGSKSAVTLYRNVGGNFDAPPATTSTVVGTGTLELIDCSSAQLTYAFSDGTARAGTIPLIRLTANVTCAPSGAPATNPFFALSGNWFDPATSGQGFTVEVNPVTPIVFMTWYTYAPNGETSGPSGQRWFSGESAQTAFAPGQRTFDLTLYETVGGLFDAAITPPPVTTAVGSATLTFLSCTTAQLAYSFTGGSSAGRSGTIVLARLGPTPPGCVS